jgi:hypothetical protein
MADVVFVSVEHPVRNKDCNCCMEISADMFCALPNAILVQRQACSGQDASCTSNRVSTKTMDDCRGYKSYPVRLCLSSFLLHHLIALFYQNLTEAVHNISSRCLLFKKKKNRSWQPMEFCRPFARSKHHHSRYTSCRRLSAVSNKLRDGEYNRHTRIAAANPLEKHIRNPQ